MTAILKRSTGWHLIWIAILTATLIIAGYEAATASLSVDLQLKLTGKDREGRTLNIPDAIIVFHPDADELLTISSSGSVSVLHTPLQDQMVPVWAEVAADGVKLRSNPVGIKIIHVEAP